MLMQITCPGCGCQLPVESHLAGTNIQCGGCNTLVQVPNSPEPIGLPPAAPDAYVDPHFARKPVRSDWMGNESLIITAASCLLCVMIVVGIVILTRAYTEPVATEEAVATVEDIEPEAPRTFFKEGYSIELPDGFKRQSREKLEEGVTVYRFETEKGYRFTMAIIPDESVDRFSHPPDDLSGALFDGVKDLRYGPKADLKPSKVIVDSMGASIFRYYERETFRGITFTYVMAVLDPGKKLILRFSGRYGGFHEDEENFEMPSHWYESLKSFEKGIPVPKKGPVSA